jgi:predicted component of type VI protein secretion system
MSDATQKFRIGRDSACDLVITDRSVSRRHADLMIESDGGLEILDRESSSGTFLLREGKEHSISRARLRPSDSIRFGDCEMSVKDLVEKLRRLPVRGAALRASASDSLPPLPVKIPPLPAQATSTAPVAAGRMARCECGAIKKRGAPCPSCGS